MGVALIEVLTNLSEPHGEETAGAISLNDFELIRVIGRGSYAKVLMVELKKTKRIYAMKVIKKELVTDDEVMKLLSEEKDSVANILSSLVLMSEK